MRSNLSHIFSKQFSNKEKESIFDFIRVKILEDSKAHFTTTPDTILCKIPFFVSRGNPYGIFDAILCTLDIAESGNTRISYVSSHIRSIIAKLGVGLFFGVILAYILHPEDILWKVSLYGFLVLAYIGALLWKAQKKNKKLFQKIIEYSEAL